MSWFPSDDRPPVLTGHFLCAKGAACQDRFDCISKTGGRHLMWLYLVLYHQLWLYCHMLTQQDHVTVVRSGRGSAGVADKHLVMQVHEKQCIVRQFRQFRQFVDTSGVLATCMLSISAYHLISRYCGSYSGVFSSRCGVLSWGRRIGSLSRIPHGRWHRKTRTGVCNGGLMMPF